MYNNDLVVALRKINFKIIHKLNSHYIEQFLPFSNLHPFIIDLILKLQDYIYQIEQIDNSEFNDYFLFLLKISYEYNMIEEFSELSLLMYANHSVIDIDSKCFNELMLKHAVNDYIVKGHLAYGYSSFDELTKSLDKFNEKQWENLNNDIALSLPISQRKADECFEDKLPMLTKQSLFLALIASIILYCETKSMLLATIGGTFTAGCVLKMLSNEAYRHITLDTECIKKRASDILNHNRFFKPKDNSKTVAHPLSYYKSQMNPVIT